MKTCSECGLPLPDGIKYCFYCGTKYNVANSIFNEMSKQLEQAKMQVKKDTPVFTIVQPVKVPNKSYNSRTKTLIIWTFLGGILGCGIVLGRHYSSKIKEMFTSPSEQDLDGSEII